MPPETSYIAVQVGVVDALVGVGLSTYLERFP
jgi:hypothetical protein